MTVVYRMYGKPGDGQGRRLLYVGLTDDWTSRFRSHHTRKHWFYDIDTFHLEYFNSRATAARAEAVAIRDERPMYNIATPDPDDIRDTIVRDEAAAEAVEQNNAQLLLERIAASPGDSFNQLRKNFPGGHTRLTRLLARLVADGAVEVRSDGYGRRCHYVAGGAA